MTTDKERCQKITSMLSTLTENKQRSEVILQSIIQDLSQVQITANIHTMQLEKQVQYLTRELTKSNLTLQNKVIELEDTRDRAIKSNKAKSAFIATVSRQLRMPLDAIIGYSTLLLEGQGNPEELHDDLQQVNVGAGQILDLINDILELSELESGQRELSIDDFVVEDFVNEIETTSRKVTDTNNNKLIMEVKAELGVMSTDMKKLRQALLHLIKAVSTRNHDHVIHFSVETEIRHNLSWYIFKVSDSSEMKMPGENFEHLFDPFIDVPITNAHILEGCGLGMAITKHICNILHGRCGIVHDPDYGPTFSIAIPETHQLMNMNI